MASAERNPTMWNNRGNEAEDTEVSLEGIQNWKSEDAPKNQPSAF